MEQISLYAAVIYLVLFTIVIAAIPVAIVRNLKKGQEYRDNLARKLEKLRINRMLKALGVDINRYLHQESSNEIRDQIERCGACENTDQCDEQLSKGNVQPGQIGYCNNEPALSEIAIRQQAGS